MWPYIPNDSPHLFQKDKNSLWTYTESFLSCRPEATWSLNPSNSYTRGFFYLDYPCYSFLRQSHPFFSLLFRCYFSLSSLENLLVGDFPIHPHTVVLDLTEYLTHSKSSVNFFEWMKSYDSCFLSFQLSRIFFGYNLNSKKKTLKSQSWQLKETLNYLVNF